MDLDDIFQELADEGWTAEELDELAAEGVIPEIEIAAEYGET